MDLDISLVIFKTILVVLLGICHGLSLVTCILYWVLLLDFARPAVGSVKKWNIRPKMINYISRPLGGLTGLGGIALSLFVLGGKGSNDDLRSLFFYLCGSLLGFLLGLLLLSKVTRQVMIDGSII